jgi:sucrose phosphorylase
LFHIAQPLRNRALDHLTALYGIENSGRIWERLQVILREYARRNPALQADSARKPLSERDAILITYGDQFQEPGVPPLRTLHEVLWNTLGRPVSGVHILPFYPYSSDDGFSVIDYTQVNPELGSWDDIGRLGRDFRLMFDAVLNHASRQSHWFQCFVAGDAQYSDWFLTVEPGTNLSTVVRPRSLPLLHAVDTSRGRRWVWTTFSDDQIDLNYGHPAVLLKMIEILLFYVEKGAQIIRLDAIAYLWKEIGTSCILLPQTHRVVKLLRTVLDAVAPGVVLITETNVPHEENISYFGALLPGTDRTDEARLVYQFPLAPLVMHSILSGDAGVLSQWAAGLETPAREATFFNFTASHDGIGVTPARGLLSEGQIQELVDTTIAHGGRVSLRDNPDAPPTVYELNISYFDALSDPQSNEPLSRQVQRFMCSQAIMLAVAGVPGIYVHSLLGSRSWHQGVERSGRNRTINRQKFDRVALERELADPASLRAQVFSAYRCLLQARSSEPAFHPYGGQRVLFLNNAVFTLLRTSPQGDDHALCLHNISGMHTRLQFEPSRLGLPRGAWRDLLSDQTWTVSRDGFSVELLPYAARWLINDDSPRIVSTSC